MNTAFYALIYDVIFLALLIAAALLGRRRGFLASLVLLVGSVAAILGAAWAARTFAPALYDSAFAPLISEQVAAVLAEAGGDAAELLARLDFLPQSIAAALANVLSRVEGTAGPQAAEALTPVILPLVQALLFLVVYLVLRALVRLVASLLRHLNAVPVVGSLNRVLGLVLGLGIGAVNCWVCAMVLWLASVFAAGRVPLLGAGTLSASALYRFFAALNPFLTHY